MLKFRRSLELEKGKHQGVHRWDRIVSRIGNGRVGKGLKEHRGKITYEGVVRKEGRGRSYRKEVQHGSGHNANPQS